MTHRLFYVLCVGACVGLASQACSDDSSGEGDGDAGGNGAGDGDGDSGTTLDITTSGDSDSDSDSDSENGGGGGGGPVCETVSAAAELPPVYLAFAFDVSGSMGQLDQPRWWHDPESKWQPVVEATSAFFEDSSSQGLSASMALFPALEDQCESDNYANPEVSMTALPSDAFSDAFSDYEDEVGSPLAGGDWRGGTPTQAALTGVGTSLDALRGTEEEAEFAIVLVTDGLPQGCDADISGALQAAEDFYADGLPTYVIGIENPTTPPDDLPDGWDDWGSCDFGDGGGDTPCTPPDTLEALNELARVGGTDAAFLIDTGDPSATERAFRAAIEAIRESSLACTIPMPENPESGTSFDPDKVDVSVSVDGKKMRLNYDSECEESDSWHYDDEDDPKAIELCESACAELQANPDAELSVDFLCEPRPDIIR